MAVLIEYNIIYKKKIGLIILYMYNNFFYVLIVILKCRNHT